MSKKESEGDDLSIAAFDSDLPSVNDAAKENKNYVSLLSRVRIADQLNVEVLRNLEMNQSEKSEEVKCANDERTDLPELVTKIF